LEFKRPTDGIKDYTRWFAQAVDYTHVEWAGGQRLVILTCPGAASWLARPYGKDDNGAQIVKRIAGQLGVGELVVRWGYGLTMLLNDAMIWSERNGVGTGRRWSLTPKVGNR